MRLSPPTPTFGSVSRWIVFLVVLFGTLFPIGWLSTINPVANSIDSIFFSTDLSHAIAHAILFFAVGIGALAVFRPLRYMPWRFFALMVLVSVAQEAFQLVYKQRPIGFDEYRDLLTDAVGYVVALLLVQRIRNRA